MSRFVILGSSPNRKMTHNVTGLILDSTVIGLNRVRGESFPLDHWIVWDTHDMQNDPEMAEIIRKVNHHGWGTTWFRENSLSLDGRPQGLPPFFRYQLYREAAQGEDWTQPCFDGKLKLPCRGSVCTTASALAYLLGATEIWLVGVDFASPGPTPDWTPEVLAQTAKFVNEFYKDFPIPVYKTFNGGPLELEYREYGR